MATPVPELAFLVYPVWVKFTALSVAGGFAAWALARQHSWLPAALCAPAPVAIGFALAEPYWWGENAVALIALGWLAMLGWAGWRTWRGDTAVR
jgi:hypothetical protein